MNQRILERRYGITRMILKTFPKKAMGRTAISGYQMRTLKFIQCALLLESLVPLVKGLFHYQYLNLKQQCFQQHLQAAAIRTDN